MKHLNPREAIDAVKKDTLTTQAKLAELVGMRRQSNVSEALKRDVKISLFVRFMNAMGYDVIVRRKDNSSGNESVDEEITISV